jgi:hypothetical protein
MTNSFLTCPHGHELAGENLYIRPSTGTAECRACRRGATLRTSHRAKERFFGLPDGAYEAMLEAQAGCCAICGKSAEDQKRRLSIDHCHVTGEVRGLLCTPCNTGLGSFGDSVDRLGRAVAYLREHDASPELLEAYRAWINREPLAASLVTDRRSIRPQPSDS